MRLIVFKGEDGWRWRAKARNGRILCSSEAFANKSYAIRACIDFHAEGLGDHDRRWRPEVES